MDKFGRLTCAQAREIDLVQYLAGLGFQPLKIRGNNFWYRSPFRNERTASFKVDRSLNRWYDFGEGCGGNLIDFAIRFNNWTVGEFLDSISGYAVQTTAPRPDLRTVVPKPEPAIEIIAIKSLSAYPLLNYLEERRIPVSLADLYCREISYRIAGRKFYAIGFKNDEGGWELRNPYFKGSSFPKAIRSVIKGHDTLSVFEGFIDLLSFMQILKLSGIEDRYDYLVLNSLALFERARTVMERYRTVQLFLDNDQAGRNYTRYALGLGDRYQDRSRLYANHKDINEWLCFPGTTKPP